MLRSRSPAALAKIHSKARVNKKTITINKTVCTLLKSNKFGIRIAKKKPIQTAINSVKVFLVLNNQSTKFTGSS